MGLSLNWSLSPCSYQTRAAADLVLPGSSELALELMMALRMARWEWVLG
jgi:hypothetical protein